MAMGLSIPSTRSGGIPSSLFSQILSRNFFSVYRVNPVFFAAKRPIFEPRRFFSDFKELMNSKIA
jgi:hypothetical protein